METLKVDLDGQHQRLIDINNELVSFTATIEVTPSTDQDYQVAIASQDELDNDSIKFENIKGSFTRMFEVKSAVYQNYYLSLKSKLEMKDITVKISTTPIEIPDQIEPDSATPGITEPFTTESKTWKYVVLLLILIVGGFFLRKFWKNGRHSDYRSDY